MRKSILIFEWKVFGGRDIVESFERLGYGIKKIETDEIMDRENSSFDDKFSNIIREGFDYVFSINYYPIISNNCKKFNIKYISIVYDSPLVSLYSYSLINQNNYVFIFDSVLYNEFKNGGINTVYYMPLATNVDRIDRMECDEESKKKLTCDVSFLGSMYDEKYTFYDKFKNVSPYTKGYLDALVEAQMKVYGYYFVDELLTDSIIADIEKVVPYQRNKDGIETSRYIYSNYFIARKIAELERKKVISEVSQKFRTNIYTHNDTSYLTYVNNMGSVDYYNIMPFVFRYSRINLNITLRSIKSGMPLRAIDIMGAGGFLLTNYQSDFLNDFIPGEDLVMYESIDDCVNKCSYYLKHEDERKRIAYNGYKKVKEKYNYVYRIKQILDIVDSR